jgi:hypothetical protein
MLRLMLMGGVSALALAAGAAVAQTESGQAQQQGQSGQQTQQQASGQQTSQSACSDLAQLLDQEGDEVQLDIERLRSLVEGGSNERCQIVLDEVERAGDLQNFAQDQEQAEQTMSAAEELEVAVDASRDVTATAEVSETIELERRALVEGEIVVGVPQPDVSVTQEAPEIDVANQAPDVTVQQQRPQVTVRQPQQTITMQMPAPTITIEQPAPEIVITMPDPSVDVSQTEPEVDVTMADPEVQVEQADPEIAFDLNARILTPDEAERVQDEVASGEREPVTARSEQQGEEPNVTTDVAAATVSQSSSGEPRVNIQRAEPQVSYEATEPQVRMEAAGEPNIEVRQSGEPNVTFRQASDSGSGQQSGRQGDSQQMASDQQSGQQGDGQELAADQQSGQQDDGQQMAADQQSGETVQQERPDWRVEFADAQVLDLVGADVIGERGERIGEIDSVVMLDEEPSAVLGVGGFLGLGERDVAVSLAELTREGENLVLDSITQNELRDMAEFDPAAARELDRQQQLGDL